MLKIKVNKDTVFTYNRDKNDIYLNESKWKEELIKLGEHRFHILKNNKSYNIEVLSEDLKNKSLRIKVGSNTYQIEAQDETDLILEKFGIQNKESSGISEVKAPMPGLILEVLVEEGQTVNAGHPLIILEAMKMENILKAPGDAIVQKVLTKKGNAVEKNQTLIVFQ